MASSQMPPHEHAAAQDCAQCPWCVLMGVLGEGRPEIREHLREAGRELALALRAVLDEAGPEESSGRADGLRRIDLDE